MATTVVLGDGTLTVGTAPNDFSCEVLGAKVTHTYEEKTAKRKALCADGDRPATKIRTDGFTATVENDLTAAGMYKFLLDNDLTTQALVFTPNTAAGASWEGDIQASLPANIGADETGQPIVSEVAWEGVGTFTFTPAATAP